MDIPAGGELVLGPREALNLQDMFADSMSADDRSDRETGRLKIIVILSLRFSGL